MRLSACCLLFGLVRGEVVQGSNHGVPVYDGANADIRGYTDARSHNHGRPTIAPTKDHDAALPGLQKKDHGLDFDNNNFQGNTKKIEAKVMDSPTNSPTAFPTKDSAGCLWGEGIYWPVGYKGAGFGKNYCNLWECQPGKVWKKGIKNCSTRDPKTGEQACSHTTCGFQDHCFMEDEGATCKGASFKNEKGEKKKVVQVRSHHKEMKGGKQRCNWNTHHKACMCLCHGARRQDAKGFKWGFERPLRDRENTHVNTYAHGLAGEPKHAYGHEAEADHVSKLNLDPDA